jgi:hypothetical protein
MSQEAPHKMPDNPAASEQPLHKAPSMLWFVIPLGLFILYAVLSR